MGNTAASTETVVSKSDRLQKSRRSINVTLAALLLFGFGSAFSVLTLIVLGEHTNVPALVMIALRLVMFTSFIWAIFHFVYMVLYHLELLAEPNDSTE